MISSKAIHTPAKLAEELMIERATVSRYLEQLEDRGCIERSHNNVDRRVVNIKLTSKGEEVAKLGIDIMDTVYQKMFSDLSSLENKQVFKLIKKLDECVLNQTQSA